MVNKTNTWSLRNRLLWLIDEKMGDKAQFKALEAVTGIKATHWRDFAAGKQRPTAEMIESAAQLWPQHAFWVATGITDAEHGHTAPSNNGNFPYSYPEQEAPTAFFKKAIETLNASIQALETDKDLPSIGTEWVDIALRTGWHRIVLQVGLPKENTKQLTALFKELDELCDARKLEYKLKELQPKESYEETEFNLPKRMLRLGTAKGLSKTTIKELETILAMEEKRLKIHQIHQRSLTKNPNGS